MKVTDTNLCVHCHDRIQTRDHLFVECKYTERLWLDINEHLFEHLQITLNNCNIYLGVLNHDDYYMINYIILQAKYFLYTSKCKNKIPSFESFMSILKIKYEIENIAVKKTAKYEKFDAKWQKIEQKVKLAL